MHSHRTKNAAVRQYVDLGELHAGDDGIYTLLENPHSSVVGLNERYDMP
jgi:hypothetical protein